MRSRGLYELKRHFQRDCHFRANQRFREKHCPKKVRGRDGRVLYGSKLEAEREIYMELDVPDLDFKRPFFTMFWRANLLISQLKNLVFGFKSFC